MITTVTFRALSPIPTTAMALVPCGSEAEAIALVADLAASRRSRRSSTWTAAAWRSSARTGRIGATTSLSPRTALALWSSWSCRRGRRKRTPTPDRSVTHGGIADSAIVRVCRLLNAHGVFDDTEMALPGNRRRAEQLIAVRESVPAGVNERVGRAQAEIDPRIAKTAAE